MKWRNKWNNEIRKHQWNTMKIMKRNENESSWIIIMIMWQLYQQWNKQMAY